jgi:hypothetical protein
VEAHEEPKSINWPEFRAAFHAHHVLQGLIKLKKKEFHDLKHGFMSMNEYVTKFTQLFRYAPHEVDIDEKKQECFLNGLNDGLAYAMEARDFENFQGMVNKALVLKNRRGVWSVIISWCISISQAVALDCMLLHLLLDLCSLLLSCSFS